MEHIGRPRLYTDMVKVTVRMERRLAKALEEQARSEDVSRNVLICRAMSSYLLTKQKSQVADRPPSPSKHPPDP
ncbi:MAG: hypothetical protein JRN58_09855 [Nitrososphaerota archaeon]|nr:hypothetical protein [Nitrososphaerota archaeon]MDG6979370.1 hypothetical protein [Nitrososphaerota archaeon]